jgi:hypothetical protein
LAHELPDKLTIRRGDDVSRFVGSEQVHNGAGEFLSIDLGLFSRTHRGHGLLIGFLGKLDPIHFGPPDPDKDRNLGRFKCSFIKAEPLGVF